jgi:8-oxo-dGTP pyrophosphatase MutT (NUDIX family)
MTPQFRQQTLALVERYLETFPEERPALGQLLNQLKDPNDDCSIRSNMLGHLTASAAVLSHDQKDILLIHHIFLDLWLPPGGHFELPGDLWMSAQREVLEETGVGGLTLHPWCAQHGVPLDIDTHSIPANPKKAEGPHKHHDFRFLAIAPKDFVLSPQLEEVHGARWASLQELGTLNDRRLRTLTAKLNDVLQLA